MKRTAPGPRPDARYTHVLTAGSGYDTESGDFRRVTADVWLRLAPGEYAKPGHLVAYTPTGQRVHTRRNCTREVSP